jgi:hypothetical protein
MISELTQLENLSMNVENVTSCARLLFSNLFERSLVTMVELIVNAKCPERKSPNNIASCLLQVRKFS